jgi:hypothetical protein
MIICSSHEDYASLQVTSAVEVMCALLIDCLKKWKHQCGNQSPKSKDRQHNGQTKKDKRTNNDLQNIKQKTINRATRTPIKTGVNLDAPKGWLSTMYYVYCDSQYHWLMKPENYKPAIIHRQNLSYRVYGVNLAMDGNRTRML